MLDNANLVKKIAFPREILPLSSIGVALVDFVLQMAVLLVMIVSGFGLSLPELAAARLPGPDRVHGRTDDALSAMNVRYRDVGHLLGIALLVWFWATPIVYASALVQQEFDCGDILRNGCACSTSCTGSTRSRRSSRGCTARSTSRVPEGTQYDVSLGGSRPCSWR